ncbi:MAG: hypothetical protein NTV34_10745, partial [Proteobacteria bacterium]|nr:hypothetical protein [Pseudomonadota bacterium]
MNWTRSIGFSLIFSLSFALTGSCKSRNASGSILTKKGGKEPGEAVPRMGALTDALNTEADRIVNAVDDYRVEHVVRVSGGPELIPSGKKLFEAGTGQKLSKKIAALQTLERAIVLTVASGILAKFSNDEYPLDTPKDQAVSAARSAVTKLLNSKGVLGDFIESAAKADLEPQNAGMFFTKDRKFPALKSQKLVREAAQILSAVEDYRVEHVMRVSGGPELIPLGKKVFAAGTDQKLLQRLSKSNSVEQVILLTMSSGILAKFSNDEYPSNIPKNDALIAARSAMNSLIIAEDLKDYLEQAAKIDLK